MKTIPFISALLLAAVALAANVPSGWKVLVDRTKFCQVAVPPDWIPDKIAPSMANSPDNKSSIVMHGTNQGQTLAQAKTIIEQLMPPIKVIEDSKTRLWYSYKKPNAPADSTETSWYVAIPSNGNVCAARIDFKNPSGEAVAKQIAESLAPAK